MDPKATSTTTPKTAKPMRSDAELLKLSVAEMGTCTSDEAKRLRQLIAGQDKKRKESDPDAKGILGDRSYESQPMDEMIDALGSLISGKAEDAPKSYVRLAKEDAVKLREALTTVIRLGSKMVVKGHVFDLRFDQRGHGWAKLTENWRKGAKTKDPKTGVEVEGKNEMQDEFDSYKGNSTVNLL